MNNWYCQSIDTQKDGREIWLFLRNYGKSGYYRIGIWFYNNLNLLMMDWRDISIDNSLFRSECNGFMIFKINNQSCCELHIKNKVLKILVLSTLQIKWLMKSIHN